MFMSDMRPQSNYLQSIKICTTLATLQQISDRLDGDVD